MLDMNQAIVFRLPTDSRIVSDGFPHVPGIGGDEEYSIEILAASDDWIAVDVSDAAAVRALIDFYVEEVPALVVGAYDWTGDYPINAYTDYTDDGLVIELTMPDNWSWEE